ncbi:MAG TPA: nucleotidyl transferase AbiEii/AbiGii toxin family protein [Blastocatellia bacterium]
MKLFEHPDFAQAILAAAEYFRQQRLRPSIIEKDYYVTEALRSIATWAAGRGASGSDSIIFKGGTSLSKGWNLIQRFSEDIDIFLDPLAFNPALGKRAIDRELKNVRDAVAAHSALTFEKAESRTIGGFGRDDVFKYEQHFGGTGEVANRVRTESGTASGREPTAIVEIGSYLGQFLKSQGASLQADDERPFTMRLLHFRRTFVEKMFAIHGKVELLKGDGLPLGSYARHYYDIFQLAAQPEVVAMLKSPEYAAIKDDYDQVSRAHFPKSYSSPDGMKFAGSDALFPPENLTSVIASAYTEQCGILCYGSYPAWEEVQSRLSELRDLL